MEPRSPSQPNKTIAGGPITPARSGQARFTKAQRLRCADDYRKAFETGSRISDPCFTLIVRPNGTTINRLGLAIAKKQIPHATDRNRIKRSVREAFRLLCRHPLGVDMVVLARAEAKAQPSTSLINKIQTLWGQVPSRLRSQRKKASEKR